MCVLVKSDCTSKWEQSVMTVFCRCMFQVLLRMEWLTYVVDHVTPGNCSIEWPSDEISLFLRMISLSLDVGRMKDFLCKFLVES